MKYGQNNINIDNNNDNKITPQYDSNVFEFKGELIFIDSEVINLVINEISKRFILEDFSKFETEKQVLDYFYNKEKSSLGSIDINFKENELQKQFLKNFVSELIEEKYQYNESLTNVRNKIDKKMNEIIEDINGCKDINHYNLSEKYMKKFETDNIPQFLEKNIFDAIEVIKLINEFKSKSEKEYSLNKIEYPKDRKIWDTFKDYYENFLNKLATPFEGGNNEILFQILLYSNLKDIYKSPRIKEFFINYCEIILKSLNYLEGISEFEEEINIRKDSKYIDDKLKNIFKKYEKNDYHLYAIASYFFLLMNKLKDMNIKENKIKKLETERNNLNNPLLLKILKNILISFGKYCSSMTFSLETYMYLLNYFNIYISEKEKNEKINKYYKTEDIEKKINDSQNYEFKEEFYNFVEIIKTAEKMDSLSKNLNIFLNLIPLKKKRTSHTITILISGFLSQKDDLDTWKRFFNSDKENSDYYMLKWPSSDILTFVIKAMASISNSASSFLYCYQKAECIGRILALFLLNNEEFYDCQINLVGFSLACHVVVNCINELNKFKEHRFMINNVLLMGGATVIEDNEKNIWRDIFRDNVAGRIINCYSNSDDVLSYLFILCMKKIPIGIKKLDIKDEKKEYPIVEDYDFSDIKLGHLEYRKKFEIILKRINFFNWKNYKYIISCFIIFK